MSDFQVNAKCSTCDRPAGGAFALDWVESHLDRYPDHQVMVTRVDGGTL